MAGASIVAHPACLLQPYDQAACPQPTYRHGVCFLDRGVVMSTAGSTMTVIGEGGCPQRRWRSYAIELY
jgi:hypothetical protein